MINKIVNLPVAMAAMYPFGNRRWTPIWLEIRLIGIAFK